MAGEFIANTGPLAPVGGTAIALGFAFIVAGNSYEEMLRMLYPEPTALVA